MVTRSREFFWVQSPKLWGDYGRILISGLAAPSEQEKDGPLELERTGPFIPPISFPGLMYVIVTDRFREKLRISGLGDFDFRPVKKVRIVELRWERWERTGKVPPELPPGSEPEDYISSRPHSPALATAMGSLWQVLLPKGAIVDFNFEWTPRLRVHATSWTGAHFFRGTNKEGSSGRWPLVSETGKAWLEKAAGEWVQFEKC